MAKLGEGPVRLGEVRVKLPPGYADRTLYAFRSRDRGEELLVEASHEPSLKSPQAVTADRFGEVKAFFKDKARPQADEPRKIAGREAHVITYLLDDKGGASTMGIAALSLVDNRYLELKYAAKASVSNAKLRWEALLASVNVPQPARPAPPPPAGVSRRYLVDGAVDVPDTMTWGGVYLLANPAARSRIAFAALPAGVPVPALSSDDQDPALRARIADSRKEALTIAGSHADLLVQTIRPSPDAPSKPAERVVRVESLLGMKVTLRVEFRGPEADSAALEARARDLAASVEPAE